MNKIFPTPVAGLFALLTGVFALLPLSVAAQVLKEPPPEASSKDCPAKTLRHACYQNGGDSELEKSLTAQKPKPKSDGVVHRFAGLRGKHTAISVLKPRGAGK